MRPDSASVSLPTMPQVSATRTRLDEPAAAAAARLDRVRRAMDEAMAAIVAGMAAGACTAAQMLPAQTRAFTERQR